MAGARTFDHDEAQRLLDQGLKQQEVADLLGVSRGAIRWACVPGIMKDWQRVHYRLPPDLKRALERQAKAEGRSVNGQLIKILKDSLGWEWYEEGEDCETIFAHPVAKHIKRAA